MGDVASTRLWAEANETTAARTASRVASLQEGQHAGTVENLFPAVDKDAYRAAIKGSGVFARAEKVKPIDVPLASLVSPQRSVNRERLQQHLDDPRLIPPGARAPGHGGRIDHVTLVRVNGALVIHDGNHRSVAAKLRGDSTIKARVVDLDQEEK